MSIVLSEILFYFGCNLIKVIFMLVLLLQIIWVPTTNQAGNKQIKEKYNIYFIAGIGLYLLNAQSSLVSKLKMYY